MLYAYIYFFFVRLFQKLFLKYVKFYFAGFCNEFGHAALESCQNDDRCGTYIYFYTHLFL